MPDSPSASGSSGGPAYTAAYKNKPLVIQTASGGSCGFGELVNLDNPSVSPGETSGDSFGVTSNDCVNWSFQVELYNSATGNKPLPSSRLPDNPSACLNAIASDPNPQYDPAKAGYSFCVASTDGFLAYVKIISVDSQGDVTLRIDGWSTNGSSAGGGSSGRPAYTAAYKNKPLVIQTASGGSCGFGELVNLDNPSVDSGETSGDSFGVTSNDCVNWNFQVELYNSATGNKPLPSSQLPDNPSACLNAIASDPNPQYDPAKAGYSFCVASTDGFLAYVKIISVDSQGDVTLRIDGWSTN